METTVPPDRWMQWQWHTGSFMWQWIFYQTPICASLQCCRAQVVEVQETPSINISCGVTFSLTVFPLFSVKCSLFFLYSVFYFENVSLMRMTAASGLEPLVGFNVTDAEWDKCCVFMRKSLLKGSTVLIQPVTCQRVIITRSRYEVIRSSLYRCKAWVRLDSTFSDMAPPVFSPYVTVLFQKMFFMMTVKVLRVSKRTNVIFYTLKLLL